MSDLISFTAALRRAATDDVQQIMEKWQRRIGLAALTSVVFKTPVDTGRARANWQAGGAESENVYDVLDKSGTAAIGREQNNIDQVPAFEPIYVFNNVEYIRFLEEGSSKQAPQGMAALTVAELSGRLGGLGLATGLRFTTP